MNFVLQIVVATVGGALGSVIRTDIHERGTIRIH
jgi:hypothetical protein